MPVPRNRHSTARKNSRRAHHAHTKKHGSSCSHCGAIRLPHRLCSACGHYGDRAVVAVRSSEE